MEGEHTGALAQQGQTINFTFEQQDTRLIINAQTDNILYCAVFETHPLITFESVRNVLESKNNFKVVEKNKEIFKINVAALFDLNFRSKDKMAVD